MSESGRDPSDADWKRLSFGFGTMFVITGALAAMFMWALPFGRIIRLVAVSPPVLVVGWVWIWVVLRQDAERLRRINAFAQRRGGGR